MYFLSSDSDECYSWEYPAIDMRCLEDLMTVEETFREGVIKELNRHFGMPLNKCQWYLERNDWDVHKAAEEWYSGFDMVEM